MAEDDDRTPDVVALDHPHRALWSGRDEMAEERVSMEIDSAAAVRDDTRREMAALRAEVERLTEERDGAIARWDDWRKQAMDANQRAERAEGEVARLRADLDASSQVAGAKIVECKEAWRDAKREMERAERAEALLKRVGTIPLENPWSVRWVEGYQQWNLRCNGGDKGWYPTLDAARAAYDQSRETTDAS